MDPEPKTEKILRTLGDEQTLKIFRMASAGLKASLETCEELGLTKKQYYSRLESLLRLNLIKRSKGAYYHTYLGSIVNNTQIKPLDEALSNFWDLVAVDELRQSEVIPEQEKGRIIEAIKPRSELVNSVAEKGPAPLQMIRSYRELVGSTVAMIRSAKKEIYLATAYYEPEVTEAIIERVTANVRFNYLDGKAQAISLQNKLQTALRSQADPSKKAVVMAILNLPNVKMRRANLAYSFMVIDGQECEIEIPNPRTPLDFNLAMRFHDESFSKELIAYFEELWQKAEEPNVQVIGKQS